MRKIGRLELRELAVNTLSVTLGEEIRTARERLQMTQPELAARVGVSESTVSNWERDQSKPKNRMALVRQVLQMDDEDGTAELALTEERVLRRISDQKLWAEATRRFLRGTSGSGEPILQRGQYADVPDNLKNPQAVERGESDA